MSTLFGRPCAHWAPRLLSSLAGLADHGAPACLWGLANRARITRHLRSYVVWRAMRALGAQIAVRVGLPRAEPKAMALCKALRGKRCNCFNLVRFCPPRGHWEPAIFWDFWQQRLINSYARKYTTFLQHLRLMMCLSLCVAMIHFKVSRFALKNTWKRFEEQSDSSCSCKNCNVCFKAKTRCLVMLLSAGTRVATLFGGPCVDWGSLRFFGGWQALHRT